MKKQPVEFTGAEDSYIRQNMTDQNPGTIAAFLKKDNPKITETSVREHIHRIKDNNKKSKTKKLFAQKNGVTILTEAASERGDDLPKSTKQVSSKYKKPFIHKIDPTKP